MRTKVVALSLGCVIVVVGVIALVTQVYSSGPHLDPEASPSVADLGLGRAEDFKLDDWPAAVSTSYGFEWNGATYSELSGFTEQENETTASDPYWKDELAEYRCFVTRTVRLEDASGTELTVCVTRCPNYDAAKNRMVRTFTQSSMVQFDYHGSTFGLDLGDISILRDAYMPPAGYQGIDSNNLIFVRGNLIVDVSFSPPKPQGLSFTAAELCQSIDAEILAQYNAVSGNYEVPTVGVSITAPVGDLTNLPPTTRSLNSSVAVFKSHPSSEPVQTRAYVAQWAEPMEMDEYGIWTPDPSRTPYWWVDDGGMEDVFLDDVANPTNLTMQMSNDAGDWQLVVFAWGPNLVPVVDAADYTIIR